jgi:N,N'-diacetyl-8-epilegionaminate cytidylyltransferase
MTNLNIVAFVFARGGSKGIPGKNLQVISGVPLIGHAVRAALAATGVTECIVSTDDLKIAEVAVRFGAKAPFLRPPELATDQAPEWLAWQHAIHHFNATAPRAIDVFLSVPTTAPLRSVLDIDASLAAFHEGQTDAIITVTPARRNPYFNMVTIDRNGYANLMMTPANNVTSRQAAPEVFNMTTVAYVADPRFILRASGLFDGRIRAVVVPPERALDIDLPIDLQFAEFLMSRRV